ncbi:unnamed protein product [Arctia plantaginis]|uniref:CLIP domain-containing serine protease n=1 Tax=Arctia plantaginis TaxID=874455 RepID=A0A8S0YYZ7_ARCPL|nr:unnamed protein product [Arctia plantaginis]
MAKIFCVLLCACVIFQTVWCQFGFFPPRGNNQNRNFVGQSFLQGQNAIRDGFNGIFNPNRQRPTVKPIQEDTIYIIETDVPVNQNGQNGQNSGRPMIFVEEENSGNVNFNGNNGFQPNRGNEGFRPNQGNGGFFPNQGNQEFLPNQGNGGVLPNQGNQGFLPNQGNEGFQPDGAVNFGNNQQNPTFGGNQNNEGHQEKSGQDGDSPAPTNDPVNFDDISSAPETSTLPALTPVPAVKTESRNSFNFGSPTVFGATCDTVDGGVGNCISLYNCQQYLKLVQESRAEATKILRKAHCGFEGNNPKVCCPLPGIPTAPPQPPTTTTTTTTTTTAAPVTAMSKTALGDFVDSLPDPPVCGVSNATFSRVVGGINAKLGDFPWMALLGYKSRRGGTSWLCGGSLISSHHILTAAHCIHNHENDLYVVRLGELDLAREDEGATPLDVMIKQKIKHAEYSATSFTNDIGILILDRNVEFTDLIRPICIPKDSELRARSFEDYTPLIAGWGHTEFRGPSATHLQVLQLPVVSNDFCTQAYAAYKAQKIDERVLCAGYKKGGKDACQGDSGGPLMQPIWSPVEYKTYFFQIGVVSYGRKCAEAGFPGVYSRITHFVNWIEEQIVRGISR